MEEYEFYNIRNYFWRKLSRHSGSINVVPPSAMPRQSFQLDYFAELYCAGIFGDAGMQAFSVRTRGQAVNPPHKWNCAKRRVACLALD